MKSEVWNMFRKLGIVCVCAVALAVMTGPSACAQPSAAQREEHEKTADKTLQELNRKMDELASQSRKTAGKAQVEINRLYEEFKKKQGDAGKELEDLRKATNESWDEVKARTDKAIEDLNGLYERATSHRKEQEEVPQDRAK
jgi:uncharacterized coiled-coil protein SlyX